MIEILKLSWNWNWIQAKFGVRQAGIIQLSWHLINIYCFTKVKTKFNQAWKPPVCQARQPVNAASYSFIKTARRGGVGCWLQLLRQIANIHSHSFYTRSFIHSQLARRRGPLHRERARATMTLTASATATATPTLATPSPRCCPLWKIVFPDY